MQKTKRELLEFAQWIEESKLSIKKKDVQLIKEIPSLILAYKTISGLQSAIYNHAPLVGACSAIGKLVCLEYEDPNATIEQENLGRVNVGYHLANVLFDHNKLSIRRGKTTRDPYTIKVVDDEWIDSILYSVNADPLDIKIYSKPVLNEPLQYDRFHNPVLGDMVRKCNPEVLKHFKYDNTPIVYDVINKQMRVPFCVNEDVYNTIIQCKNDNVFTHRNKDLSKDARVGIRREQTGVLDAAKAVMGSTFYQSMFYDFRGRLYSSMLYFSPQGSPLAKSLFYFNDSKPIGSEGWFWLLVDASTKWGEDKLSLDDGFNYAESRLDEWLVWAEDPVNNKGWQEADDYWGFLASILEIKKAIDFPDGKELYPSGLPIAWDATCSGLQVLAALSRDKASGELCNLTGDKRGDYYQMIADTVWKDFEYTDKDVIVAQGVEFDLARLNKVIDDATDKEAKAEAIDDIKLFIEHNRDDLQTATKVFWGNPIRKKLARKIVKRPCMTYFYSCGPKTMAKQMFGDFKSEPEFAGVTMSHCYFLCNRVYKACREKMPIATQLMDAWIELGKKAYYEGKDFTINGPYNNFKLTQYYRNPVTKRVKMQYKGKPIQLRVLIGFSDRIKYRKVLSATSPNVVHMMDSQIIAHTVMNADYDLSCIHDSFSTIPADAGRLYEDVRWCFVKIFNDELFHEIMEEQNFETDIELGDLDINDVLDQQWFCK